MEAKEAQLNLVLSNSEVYSIPKYQRPYSWSEENAQELIDDTFSAFLNNEEEYFIGSVILIKNWEISEVVDGQQRLTTITLLFAKLRDLIERIEAKNEIQNRILPLDAFTGRPASPRLLVREQDQDFFKKYILLGDTLNPSEELSETQQKFINNSWVFWNFLSYKTQEQLLGFTKFLLEKVFIVLVKTNDFASAFRLFNVLNARWMSLSNADLIKNMLFEKSNHDRVIQDEIEKSWNKLEELIKIENLDQFFSHHRTSLIGEKQLQGLNKEYEEYFKKSMVSVSDFLRNLIKSAENYSKIRDRKFNNIELKKLFTALSFVSYDEWIPAILAFMNNIPDWVDILEFVHILEKITYQSWIRRLWKTERNRVYYRALTLINEWASRDMLFQKITEFSKNSDYIQSLRGDVYGTPFARAVLLRIEQEMSDNSVSKDFHGVISVEHILPQKMQDEYWISRFSVEQHIESLHKLWNLTLLSGKKNSAASNYDFKRKQAAYKKWSASAFDLTKEIVNMEEWNVDYFTRRQQKLLDMAEKIWTV
jgi:uncharacterized protein with ParB-like and HNH nuclease domain